MKSEYDIATITIISPLNGDPAEYTILSSDDGLHDYALQVMRVGLEVMQNSINTHVDNEYMLKMRNMVDH